MSQLSPTNPAPGTPALAPGMPGYSLLLERLRAFGEFRKRWTWFHALAWLVILGPGSIFAWILLDMAVKLPWYLLLPSCIGVLVLTLYALIRYGVVPLFGTITAQHEAVVIESLHGKLDNQIIGSLQLGLEVAEAARKNEKTGYSPVLVDALIARTADHVGKLDLPGLIDRRKAHRDLKYAAAIVIALVVFAVASPKAIATRIDRVADAYATLLDMLFPVEIHSGPGDLSLVRGSPVPGGLTVDVIGARRAGVRLLRTDLKTHQTMTDELTLDHGKASFAVDQAKESFAYQFEYANRKSPEHKILVGDVPAIAAMNTELAYPIYTGMPTRTLIGRLPKLQVLNGTGVLVSIASTVDLHPELSYVTWQNGDKQPLSVAGRFAHFSFTVDRPDRATIHLTGALGKGFEMPEPVSMEIVVQRDLPPTVEVLLRNKKLTMLGEEAAGFGVNALAEDDFGVAEVMFDYKIDTIDPLLNRPTRQGTVSRLIEPAKDRVKVSFTDVFKAMSPPLEPGDRITITVGAKDNNTQTGPGMGRAAPIEIVVVRPDLGSYVEQNFGFDQGSLLGGLKKVQRATNLLIEAERTAYTEAKAQVDKQDVKSRVGAEGWPGGSEDAVGDYFRLLSGEKQ